MVVDIFKIILVSLERRVLYTDIGKWSNFKAKLFGVFVY